MKLSLAALGGMIMTVSSAAALADDLPGWYVAPMGSYAKVDKNRCTDDAVGATLALGRHEIGFNLELEGQYLSLPYDCPGASPRSGTGKLKGTQATFLKRAFADNAVLKDVYGLIGVGEVKRGQLPKLPDGYSNLFIDAGAAYIHGLELFGQNFSVRGEARYRYQTEGEGKIYGTARHFQDLVFNIGVQIPFFTETPAPPPPEPVAVIPAQEPVPEPIAVAPPVEPAPAPEPAAPPAPPTIETAKAGDTIVLKGVNFETAKATLTTNAKTILDGVAKDLNARPELKVEIGGHTDARGKASYNKKLSERRAQSVMAYLTGQGVAAERLSAVGYGLTQPVDSNETDEGRERNRRVELKILQ